MNKQQHLSELSPQERTKILIDRIATHLRYRKEIEENQEDVDNVKVLIKETFEDIKNPSVNRLYKLNLEKESKFDVEIVPQDKHIEYDPFEHLKHEPDITRKEWNEASHKHQNYFDRDYDRLKEWHSEEVRKAVGNQQVPYTNEEPTKVELVLDEEIINMAKGFMVGPVGVYKGRAVQALTQKFDNLAEMKIFLKVQCKNQDMVMYMAFRRDNKYFWRGAFVAPIDYNVALSTCLN